MAREIYKVELRESFFPALSEQDAIDMADSVTDNARLEPIDVIVTKVVSDEHTMKLFELSKTLYDMEKFSYKEIKASLVALAMEMGYYTNAEDLAEMITTWTERVGEDMPPAEFQEWLMG